MNSSPCPISPACTPQPPGLFKRLSDSFGYLTTKGYCAAGKCLKWPVLLGEFSAPHAKAPQVLGRSATTHSMLSG